MPTTLDSVAIDFTDPLLTDVAADTAAMEWQDSFAATPSDELRENLRQYSDWKTRRRRPLFSHAETVEARRRAERENETLDDWLALGHDASFAEVAKKRGFLDGFERAAELIPREELRPKLARDLFVQDITGATPEELRTGVPQMKVAKEVLGIDEPSDEAFDAGMSAYLRGKDRERDRRRRMQDLGSRMAVTKLTPQEAWTVAKSELSAEELSPEEMEASARTLYFTREHLQREFGDVIPLARRVFATVAQAAGTDAAAHRAFPSLDEAVNAFATLPEEDFPKMVFALDALAREHGEDVDGFFRKVAGSFDRGMEAYGISLDTFMRGRQAAEIRKLVEEDAPIYVPVEEARTPRDAALNVLGNLARGQGIGEYGLHADRDKERRLLTAPERLMLDQFATHLTRLQSAKQVLKDYKGEVSRIQSENMLAQGVYDATQSLPYMGAAFAGPIGTVLNGAVYSEDNFRQLKAQHPDVDDATLRNVADAAAVPMAAIERFQAKTLFGKFPGANKLLKGLAGGGFLKRTAVTTAAEFGQENVQNAMLPVARELAERITDDSGLDASFRGEMKELAEQAPRTFFAILPLSVLGAGGATVADRFRRNHLDAMMADRKGMQALAFTDEEIDSVTALEGTEEKVERFQEIYRGKTAEQRQQATESVMESATEGSMLPVVRPRAEGGFEVSYPDGTTETAATEEEAVSAHSTWIAQHFEEARRVSEEALSEEDIEGAFEEEQARFQEARPGVEVTESEAATIGGLRRSGQVTISQAWQRVRDYAAQTGTSLEGFTPSDFDQFTVRGSADAEARFANGVLEGAITLAKGEKDVAALWEEQAETYMHAQLNEGGRWSESELLTELRRVERQTGKQFLAGESRDNLVEGFSYVAREYAAGNFADLNFGEKLKRFLNLMAEKIAAMFTLSKDLRRLSQGGELSPALESTIRESLGFDGNQETEMERLRTDAEARMVAENVEPPAGETLSISRDGESLFSLANLIAVKSGGVSSRAKVWKTMAREVRGVRQRSEKRGPSGMDAEAAERSLAELDLQEELDSQESAQRLETDLAGIEVQREEERNTHTRNLEQLDHDEETAIQSEGERLLAKWGPERKQQARTAMAEARKTVAARFKGLRDKERARHRAEMTKLATRERERRREAKRREEAIGRRGKAGEDSIRAQADEFTKRQARFEQLQDIATLEAIARALPAAVRGKLSTSFRKLAELRTSEARGEYLVSLLPKIEQALESHLQTLYRTAIRKEVAKGEAKLSDARTRGGKIGAVGHAVLDQVKVAMPLEPEAATFRGEVLQQMLENAGIANPTAEQKSVMDPWAVALNESLVGGESLTVEQIEELDGRIAALELFGDYQNADSARLEEALAFLQGVYTDGRREWVEVLVARRELRDARVKKLREGLKMDRPIEDRDRSRRVRADESKLRRLGEGLMGAMIGGSQTFRRLAELSEDPEVSTLVEEMEWDFAAAEIDQQERDLKDSEEVSQALRAILGARSRHGLAKRLHELSSNDKQTPVPVSKIEGRRTVTISVPVKFAEAIVNGEAGGFDTRSGERVELSARQVKALATELEAFLDLPEPERVRRRSIPVTTVEAAGERKSIGPVSQLEALQLYLTMRQPDQAEKLEGLGYDAETMAELEAFLEPQTKALGAWMTDYLAADQMAIDALHRTEKGIGLRLVERYFPVRNDVALSTTGEIALDGGGIQHTGRSISFTKQRVTNSAPPDYINALAVFLAHRQQTNFWLSHVSALREWGGVLRDERLSGSIKARMGSAFHEALQRRFRRIEAGGSLRANSLLWIERAVKSVVRNFAIGVLGGRVSTLVANTSAVANVTYEVPYGELLAGMRDVIANPAAFRDAWKSPAIQRRLKGGATFEAQLAKSRGPTAKPLMAVADAAAMPAMEAINIVDTGANTVAAAFIWERTRKQSLADGLSEEQARAAADRKVDVVLLRAAQPTLRFAKSEFELMMLESPLSLPFALFISERRKNTAITFMAVRELLTGKGTYGRGMAAQQAFAGLVVMPALVTALGSMWAATAKGKDDEEESWWARYKDRMTDPKAWAYALSTEHLRSVPVLGEGAAATAAGAFDSDAAEWIIENTLPADFAERWQESEVRYFDSNPNPLVRAGRQAFRSGDIFAADATVEERADAAIDSVQAWGTLIPGAAVAAQAANLGESVLGAYNTAGGSLSEADRIELLKARFSKFSRDLDDTLGPSTREDGKPDKKVRRAKRDAKADKLASILAPMDESQREAFLEALSSAHASQEVRKRAGKLLRHRSQ